MKKKVFLLADSSVNLKSVYETLKDHYEITWVYYHKNLKSELQALGCSNENLIFIGDKSISFFLKRLINKVFGKFINLKINYERPLLDNINLIDKKFTPDLWITDTGSILSKCKISCTKVTFKHGVSYKNYFLNENIFQYDYVFIPGEYHYKRILNQYPNKNIELKKKLLIAPSPKIYPFLIEKDRTQDFKSFFEKYNIDIKRKTVVLAPTFNAFNDNRFLPKNFGKESLALKKICEIITEDLNYNFIIKPHHYHHNKLSQKEFNFLNSLLNVKIFKPNKYYDSIESDKIFFLADIVITDISGVGPACCFLNKKMIYLDPDENFDRTKSDIEKELRPGFIWNNLDELKNILLSYNNDDNLYEKERIKFKNKIFKYQSLNDLSIIKNQIKKILSN